MVRHPAERWSRLRMSRREFLRKSATAGLALPTAAVILAACAEEGPGPTVGEEAELRVGTRADPVELQLFDDNQPIASGLQPESGPLRIFNWEDYFWKRVLNDFGEKYGVEWEYIPFYNLEDGIAKFETGEADFDVFFPTIDYLPGLVARKLIQPLNHDYLDNVGNVWPELQDPFYDKGSRYSIPYTIYQTGIGWRTDMVPLEIEDFEAMPNAWDIFWDPTYKGITGLYDDYREAMTMALFRNGIDNTETGDPAHLELARDQLSELKDLMNIRYTVDGAYAKLPEGVYGLHQAWSGDMVATPYYISTDTDPHWLRYYWPAKNPNTYGLIGNDLLTIPRGAKNPVLAHHFLNYYMERKVALKNFSWVGYQPAQNDVDPEGLLGPWIEKGAYIDGYILDTMASTMVFREDFTHPNARQYVAVPGEVDQLWQAAWAQIKAGVPAE